MGDDGITKSEDFEKLQSHVMTRNHAITPCNEAIPYPIMRFRTAPQRPQMPDQLASLSIRLMPTYH